MRARERELGSKRIEETSGEESEGFGRVSLEASTTTIRLERWASAATTATG